MTDPFANSMTNAGLYTAKRDNWGTPRSLFRELDHEFHFECDVCATPENAKCAKFFTPQDNGLLQDWNQFETVFMNPPYGKKIVQWIKKAHFESCRGVTTVGLLPARTDTTWFHQLCLLHEIRFIKGRVQFDGAKGRAPFPSMIVIFKPAEYLAKKLKTPCSSSSLPSSTNSNQPEKPNAQ